MSLALLLQKLSSVLPEQSGMPTPDDVKSWLPPILDDVRSDCESVGLRLSIKQVDRVKSLLDLETTTLGQLATSLTELHNRIGDEIEDSLFVQIVPSKVGFLTDTSIPDSLGVALAEATFDLNAGSKCIAFGRNTAAAFHLMRVIELSLRKFAELLSVQLEAQASWGPIIDKIDHALRQYKGDDKDRLTQVLTQFISIKNAWRNPTMHVGPMYDDGQVLAIYMLVRLLIDVLVPILSKDVPL
jgi:hypothetical protein